MWDPEFCEHVAPTPEARECLLAAGFVDLEANDASGTPYLAHRHIPPRMLRAMALELKRQSAELEGGGGGGESNEDTSESNEDIFEYKDGKLVKVTNKG